MSKEDITGRIISAISGETVLVAGGITVSGNIITVNSGVGVIIQSGASVITAPLTPTSVMVGNILAVTGASGGVAISSGIVISTVVKAIADNSGDIYVGGSGENRNPFSGYGYIIRPGEAVGMDINNLNSIKVTSVISGDKISFIGIG